MVEKKTQTEETIEKLEQGINELFESEKYKKFLTTMSKFHDYSFGNVILILLQKPDASLVSGYNAWRDKFHRQVNKGEKAIKILAPSPYKKKVLATVVDGNGRPVLDSDGKEQKQEKEITIPCFKSVSVFDVSQTSGEELPTLGAAELSGNVKNYEKLFDSLKAIAPVPVAFEDITSGAKGYYSIAEKRIAINNGMSEAQNVKTLIHEMAHAKLHSKTLKEAKEAGEELLSSNTKECQAESIAFVVSSRYGIDTSDYSFGYIAGWSSGKEMPELKESLKVIRDTADEIIKQADEKLKEYELEQKQDQEKEAQIAADKDSKDPYFVKEVATAAVLLSAVEKVNEQVKEKTLLKAAGVKVSERKPSVLKNIETKAKAAAEITNEDTHKTRDTPVREGRI